MPRVTGIYNARENRKQMSVDTMKRAEWNTGHQNKKRPNRFEGNEGERGWDSEEGPS
jgi:hypothetical protein